MSDPKNKWSQPPAPPAPMFFGKKERDLVKQVNDELSERIIGQPIAYYPISLEESNFNETYGEAVEKISLPPVRVFAYVVVDNEQTNERYGYEYQTKLTVNFHRRRLVEDQDLYVRVGDFVQYGDEFYEIVRLYNDTRYLFGQVEHKFQVTAECVRARRGVFKVMPSIDRPVTEAEAEGSPDAPAPRPAPYPPLTATYITVTPDSKLPNERVLTAGAGISLTDGGSNSTITIAASGQNAVGPTGSIQFQLGGGEFDGNSNLVFLSATNTLSITGGLTASTLVSSSAIHSTTVSASLFNLSPRSGSLAGLGSYLGLDSNNNIILTSSVGTGTGDGIFTLINGTSAYVTSSLAIGGTSAPDHRVSISGSLSASVNISASAFYGDGSNLSGITTEPAGATTQIQYNNAGVFAGSANFTIVGSTLSASALSVGPVGEGTVLRVDGSGEGITAYEPLSGTIISATTLSASLMNLAPTSGTLAGAGSYLGLDTNNNVILSTGDGATTPPATPLNSIQFNNASAFGGSANLTFNGVTLTGSYTGSLAELTTISASAGRITGDFHIDGTVGGSAVSPTDGRLVFNNQFDGTGETTANKIVLYDNPGNARYGMGISSGDFDFFAGTGGAYRFYNNHANESVPGDEVLTIKSDGNVGIGQPIPTRLLEVVGDIYGSGSIQINEAHVSTTVGTLPIARFIGNTGSSQTPETILRLSRKGVSTQYYPAVADFNVSAYDVGGSPYGPYTQLDIALKNAASWLESGSATIMSLRDNGNVGIGTRSPTHTLTTAGSTHLSGGLVHKRTAIATIHTASITEYMLGVTGVPTEIEFDATAFADGQVVVVKDESGAASSPSPITLNPAGSQTIDGESNATIESPYGSVLLYSNGSNWFIY